MSTIDSLLALPQEAYENQTWHGPTMRGALRTPSANQTAWRPARGPHNIWDIVLHTAYWKYILRRRISGEKFGSFPLDGSN